MQEISWKTICFFQFLLVGVLCIWDGTADQELQDEVHDAEILKAVQDSMRNYNARHQTHKRATRRKRADVGVCYPELGCFESSGPFGYLDALPGSPDEIATTFLLYPGRRRARSVTLGESPLLEVPFQNLSKAWEWATKGGFNTSQPTKILVHGFGSSCSHIWVYEMRSALMSVEDCNIVCVDWENGATLPNYVKAAANTRLVGKQLSMLLRGLEKNVGLSRNKMHLIGFSLGAHVAGFAGAELKNISRITGLDPAGPLFESQDPIARLDQTDADFVDVIHSNGENLILGGLGSWLPMGHVDFYPNGGRMQNGCSNLFVGAFSDIIWSSAVEGRSLCNHRRAYKFFTDSVSPRCHFPAFPCDTYEDFQAGNCFPCEGAECGNMGYYADKSKGRGQLFLVTRDEEPFCAHQYSVKIESSPSKSSVVNYGKIKITLVGDSDLNETFTLTKKDDEQLMSGKMLSKILVPHPIIYEPKKVQILYQGYSGWLSSGLKRWRIDKVSLMDSFGKIASVCKKGLLLESGQPVNLHLYSGDCSIPTDESTDLPIDKTPKPPQVNEITNNSNETSFIPLEPIRKFIPTPVVRIGNEAIVKDAKIATLEDRNDKADDKNSVFYQWQPINDPQDHKNELEDTEEIDSARAFNTKTIRLRKQVDTGTIVEIAEPVLKKPSNKNARSQKIDAPEITEPILGPTTLKTIGVTTNKPGILTKINSDKPNFDYYVNSASDWVPSERRQQNGKNLKRHDTSEERKTTNPLKMIMMTVQFLPERLSKMFEQAEKYARETLFPLISQHTPKFISNFIVPKDRHTQYVPLDFPEFTTTKKSRAEDFVSPKTDFNPPDLPLKLERTDPENDENSTKAINSTINDKDSARSNTALQEIKPTENIQLVYAQKRVDEGETTTEKKAEFDQIPPNSKVYYDAPKEEVVSPKPTKMYVDLPVFDERDRGVKYIPLAYPDALEVAEKITKR